MATGEAKANQSASDLLHFGRARGSRPAAIEEIAGLVADGKWRRSMLGPLALAYGLTPGSIRNCYADACKLLRLQRGDYADRQEVSASHCAAQRDACYAQETTALEAAAKWAKRSDDADDPDAKARYGEIAVKERLAAAKWKATALSWQRQHDDALCLVGPKVAAQISVGAGVDGYAMVERFAEVLRKRFADRPEIVDALGEAVQALGEGDGDGE